MSRLMAKSAYALGLLLALGMLIYPIGILIAHACRHPYAPSIWWSGRSFDLMLKSLMLAGMGTVLAILISLPVVAAMGRMGSVRSLRTAPWLALPLLISPMVASFGWRSLLDNLTIQGINQTAAAAQTIWVWAMWCWPIPAMIVGLDWSRRGRHLMEAAQLDATPSQARLHVALPLLMRPLSVSGMILMAVMMGDYSVPHANGLIVYATEMLTRATELQQPLDQVWPAIPTILVITLCLGGVLLTGKQPASEGGSTPGLVHRWASWPIAVLILLSVALPIVSLMVVVSWGGDAPVRSAGFEWGGARMFWRFDLAAAWGDAWKTYHPDILRTWAVCGSGGVLVAIIGFTVSYGAKWIIGPAVLFGVWPAALVSASVLSGWQPVSVVYQSQALLVFGYVARFAWIGALCGWLMRDMNRSLVDAARADGASAADIAIHLRLIPWWPLLLVVVLITAAFALADPATGVLLSVPSVHPLAQIIIEKFHRFEDAMLVSLSLTLLAAALPPAILLGVITRLKWSDQRGAANR
jgi:ABC-type Fe3+ transport system permease subunit